MVGLPKEIVFKVSTNLENVAIQIQFMSSKLVRAQHLMKELSGQLIEIENDLQNCNVTLDLIPTAEGKENAREQQTLGEQEETTGAKARGVPRAPEYQHQEAEESEGE